MPDPQASLRNHILYLLGGGGAHVKFDDAVAGVPAKLRGKRPQGLEVTLWGVLEHMRIAQWDILDFCRNPKYREMKWPDDYWPNTDAPPGPAAWEKSIKGFRADARAMQAVVKNSKTDLFARIPWGDGQTYLREALLVADHNSYHLGQLITVRRLLSAWK